MEIKIAIKEYYPSNIALRDTSMYGGNTLHVSSGSQNGDFESGLKRYVKEAAIFLVLCRLKIFFMKMVRHIL